MNFFHEWGIPLIALLGWTVLVFFAIPPVMNRLKRKAEQSQHELDAILLSALGTPLLVFLLAVGLNVFGDMLPQIPAKWEKYLSAFLVVLFVLAGYLFIDNLMLRVLRRYSKTVDFITSTSGVIKTLYRSALLAFAMLIILDQLKITITPFLASLGIGGIVVALALQDTLANFFSGIYFTVSLRSDEYTDQYLIIHEFIKRLQQRHKAEGIESTSSVQDAIIRKLTSDIESRDEGEKTSISTTPEYGGQGKG